MSSGGGDPHGVLGVPRDASEAEIRRAYRALAKRHHPDAGQGSVARFLEIQAAYETLVGGDRASAPAGPGAHPRPGTPSRPGSRPDSEWARRGRPAASRPREPGPTRGGSSNAGPRPSAEPGPGRPGQPGGEDGRPRSGDPARGRRTHGRRRATLGSTSYDEAGDVFEPDWGGASWYGPSSGTYWTLNPREYADPRKHGPEYQARARRGAAAPPPDGAGDARAGDPGPGGSDPADAAPGGSQPADTGQTAATPPTGDATAAPRRPAGQGAAPRPARPQPRAGSPGPAASVTVGPASSAGSAAVAGRADSAGSAAPARADSTGPRVVVRVALAVLAWLVPGLALAVTADLPDGLAASLIATLPIQATGVALLGFAPRAAWAALGGAVALVFAAIPIVAAVAALGGPFVPGGPAPEAAVVLAALAWLGGLVVVAAGRVAPYPWRPPA